MKISPILGMAVLLTAVTVALGQAPAPVEPDAQGAAIYKLYCAGCHDAGPGHPGTMKLALLGRPHPPLIGRTDIVPAYVRIVVRGGLIEMPPFRATEITDADLDRLIAYIQRAKPAAADSSR